MQTDTTPPADQPFVPEWHSELQKLQGTLEAILATQEAHTKRMALTTSLVNGVILVYVVFALLTAWHR